MVLPGKGNSTGIEETNISSSIGDIVKGLENASSEGSNQQSSTLDIDTKSELGKILSTLTDINEIRTQIIKLGLNPSLMLAIETEVIPVLNILTALSTCANFYSVAAYNMSNINLARTHEIKNTLELVYNITDLSEDVFEVVKKLVIKTLPEST